MSWLWVFIGFSLLIILHEGGHFAIAKATGMRVERFFLFFGPTIWSFKRGETEYGIKAIPLGGYVKITGMNPEEEIPPEVVQRAYYRQPVWMRIAVIAAGPAVNIALAFLILFGVFAFDAQQASPTVGEVQKGTPAAKVLQVGDRILAVDGQSHAGLDNEARLTAFGEEVKSHRCPGKQVEGCRSATPVQLKILRDGSVKMISVRPEYNEEAEKGLIGFGYGLEHQDLSASAAVGRSWERMWMVTSGTVHVFSHIFESKQRKEISGIVGTSDVGHQVVEAGIAPALLLLALVSLSLGLVNLLPILPLDGGHIFWSLVEKVRGRPVSLAVMERASVLGFVLVAMLFFIGLSNDLGRITGEGFKVR
jgi:regulator of sigma E protease